jgi:hypothetical protein
VYPRVAVEETLATPAPLDRVAEALGRPPTVPLMIRLALDASDPLDEGSSADQRLRQYGEHGFRAWLSIPAPVDQPSAVQWRQRVASLLKRHGARIAILELRVDAPGDVAAFAIRAGSTDLRTANGDGRLAVAARDAGDLRNVVTADLAAYVHIASLPASATGRSQLDGLRQAHPDLDIVVTGRGVDGDGAPRAALARAQLDAIAAGIDAIAWSASAALPDALGALPTLAPVLTGDIQPIDELASSMEMTVEGRPAGDVRRWLFFDATTFATYLVYEGAARAEPVRVSLNVPVEGAPVLVDVTTSQQRAVASHARDEPTSRTQVDVPLTGSPMLIDFSRGAATVMADRSDVSAERQLTVGEIIARHRQQQSVQDELVDHYSAIARMEQHFRPNVADPGYDVVTDNRYFVAADGVEWQELSFSVNGSKWGADRPPFPLLQPEKVLSVPLQLRFSEDYRYRLSGRERVGEFDCYVVAFEPVVSGTSLYKGTLWIDARTFARVKVQAVQTGLAAPVVSNDETLRYTPVTTIDGRPVFLLTELAANQIVLIAGRNILVEKTIRFSDFAVNSESFAQARASARASDAVMYRDTDEGLRYYVKENGERVVSDRPTMHAKAMAMGVTLDPSFGFPLPIFGINYLDFDFGGPDSQLAMLFGGVLAAINVQKPKLGNTPFDASLDFFGIAVPATDRLFVDGEEVASQNVLTWPITTGVNVGWQATPFQKLSAHYQFRFDAYVSDRETAEAFELPDSTMTHGVGLGYDFRRWGYSFVGSATHFKRASWSAWGLDEGNGLPEPEPDYTRYSVSLSRDLYHGFHKIHMNVAYFGGENLDRFSRYQFGMFDDTRIHGVPASGLRFDTLALARGSYSFNIFDQYRLDLFFEHGRGRDLSIDRTWQPVTGLGAAVNVRAPYNTILRADVGRSFLPQRYSGVGSTVVQILVLKPLK